MLVFVYGTLLQGFRNHDFFLNGKSPKCIDSIRGRIYTYNGMFPYLIITNNPIDIVKGEVYEIDEKILEHLDYLEGYNPKSDYSHYIRKEVLTLEHKLKVFVYELADQFKVKNKSIRIHSGDWKSITEMMSK